MLPRYHLRSQKKNEQIFIYFFNFSTDQYIYKFTTDVKKEEIKINI